MIDGAPNSAVAASEHHPVFVDRERIKVSVGGAAIPQKIPMPSVVGRMHDVSWASGIDIGQRIERETKYFRIFEVGIYLLPAGTVIERPKNYAQLVRPRNRSGKQNAIDVGANGPYLVRCNIAQDLRSIRYRYTPTFRPRPSNENSKTIRHIKATGVIGCHEGLLNTPGPRFVSNAFSPSWRVNSIIRIRAEGPMKLRVSSVSAPPP